MKTIGGLSPIEFITLFLMGLIAMEMQAVAAEASRPLHIDSVMLAGSGCETQGEIKIRTLTPQSLIPMQIRLEKAKWQVAEQESCNMAAPLVIPAGTRLRVTAVSQTVMAKLKGQDQARGNLEVFLAGGRGKVLSATIKAQRGATGWKKQAIRENQVLETACEARDRSVILRANSRLIIQGKAGNKALAQSGPVSMMVELMSCQP